MNHEDEYVLDSIRFPYSYIRFADSMIRDDSAAYIVDTAIVHFYTYEQLDDWFMSATDDRFVIPKVESFSAEILGPTDVFFIDTILLTRENATDSVYSDSISLGIMHITIPKEIKMISDNPEKNYENCVGISVVFKPMQEYEDGDTLYSAISNLQPTALLNNFSLAAYINSSCSITQERYFNNSFITDKQVRYGQEFGPIYGYLVPMEFFGWENDMFIDFDFFVEAEPGSVFSSSRNLGIKVYPNPSTMSQEIFVKIEENVAIENVTITMSDLLGNVVSDNFTAIGPKEFSLATNKLAGGVYLITVNADNASSTIRVVLAD